MKTLHWSVIAIAFALSSVTLSSFASDSTPAGETSTTCSGYGPQAPRDIQSKTGSNAQVFSLAPAYKKMNLCNIHFHTSAEHKARDFAIVAGDREHSRGYQCKISKKLNKAELKLPGKEICNGLKPGDTIEVHWVHSSCQTSPGKGLAACLNEKCNNPALRVETAVFTLVNDKKALNFNNFSYAGNIVKGRHQAKTLPARLGKPVEYIGSTTGPKYNDQQCSPLQVTWSVRPLCGKLDINSIGQWCENNVFAENHPHGVRKLVTHPDLLSIIK